jgi:peptidoglycan/LPS O-acetylase OafA/YrhL
MPRSSRAALRHRLGSLEIGRFVAASLVVLNHALGDLTRYAADPAARVLGGWTPSGDIGVEYFFVLSGFVMLVSHHGDFGRLAAVPRFWWRRAARIYPVFWLALLVAFIVLGPHWRAREALGLISLVSADIQHYIPSAWTLRYELAFYLVFGLALLPVIGRAILGLWMALVIWHELPVLWQRVTAPVITHDLRHFLNYPAALFSSAFSCLFVAGLLAALVYLRLPLGRFAAAVLIAAGVAVLVATGPSVDWYAAYAQGAAMMLQGAGFGAVMLGLAVLERAGTLRLPALAGRLGDMSYPLYILHLPLMLIMEASCTSWLRLPLWGLYSLAVVDLAAIYAVCALVTLVYDQPVQRVLRHVGRRR